MRLPDLCTRDGLHRTCLSEVISFLLGDESGPASERADRRPLDTLSGFMLGHVAHLVKDHQLVNEASNLATVRESQATLPGS